jgi:hypothetical protein
MAYIQNPFINRTKQIYIDNMLIDINKDNVNKYFNSIYIVVKITSDNLPLTFYENKISQDTFNDMKDKLCIWKTSLNILCNPSHFNNIIIVSSNVLNNFNRFSYKLSENPDTPYIVLPILNISLPNLTCYLQQFEGITLEKIYNNIVLSEYFFDVINTTYLTDSIINIDEANYWTLNENCSNNIFDINNINNTTILSRDNIYDLFTHLDNKQQYLLFCNLLVSKKYTHLAINNYKLLSSMSHVINNMPQLFRYLIGYSWLTFYYEEINKKHLLNTNDNSIFEIDTASLLPAFPFSIKFPKYNPYMPILLDDNIINGSMNIGGLHNYKNTINGICNLNEFKTRFNLFTTGSMNDLFQSVDWNNIAITGPVMSACLQVRHPLMQCRTHDFNDKSENNNLIKYFNEYYALSYIVVLVKEKDPLKYFEIVTNIYNTITKNMCDIYKPYCKPQHVKLKQIYEINFSVSKYWIEKNIVKKDLSLEYIVENIHNDKIIELFKPYIINEYSEYFNINDYALNIDIHKDGIVHSKIEINYKFKISSPHLKHNIETLMIYQNDFMNIINCNSSPCIRAYYNGDNVYMTSLCVSAHLTYMNLYDNLNVGVLNNNVAHDINMNRMRGFGTWLNKNDIDSFIKISTSIPFWKNIYGSSIDNVSMNGNNISNLGSLSLDHKIFYPRIINIDMFHDAEPINIDTIYNYSCDIISSLQDIESEISKIFHIKESTNMISYKVIEEDGTIKPLDKNIITLYYNNIKNNTFTNPPFILQNPLLNKNHPQYNQHNNMDLSDDYYITDSFGNNHIINIDIN